MTSLRDNLFELGETYDDAQRAAVKGAATYTDFRVVSEHLGDMASVLGVTAFTIGERLNRHIEQIVEGGVLASEVQDARMCLAHVQHLAGALETLAARASELLGEAS